MAFSFGRPAQGSSLSSTQPFQGMSASEQPVIDHRLEGLLAAIDDDTDFTITLNDGDYSWRVHADVATSQSSFFKTMNEGPWQEAQQKVVKLHDDSPWMISRMLQFFYRGTFDYQHTPPHLHDIVGGFGGGFGATSPPPIPNSGMTLSRLMAKQKAMRSPTSWLPGLKDRDAHLSELEINVAMYTLADKYGITRLNAYSLKQLATSKTNAVILRNTYQGDLRNLMEKDADLKGVVAKHVAACYRTLRQDHNDWLEEWLVADMKFAILVMDCMAEAANKSSSGSLGF